MKFYLLIVVSLVGLLDAKQEENVLKSSSEDDTSFTPSPIYSDSASYTPGEDDTFFSPSPIYSDSASYTSGEDDTFFSPSPIYSDSASYTPGEDDTFFSPSPIYSDSASYTSDSRWMSDSKAYASLGKHGLLIITKFGRSGTVCNDNFDDNDAKVVCRMLGLSTSNAKALELGRQGKGGPDSLEIVLDEVNCSGYESNIEDCRHEPFWSHDCSHSEDIGVSCEADTFFTPGPIYSVSPSQTPLTGPECQSYEGRGYQFYASPSTTYQKAQMTCLLSGSSLTSVKNQAHNTWLNRKAMEGRVTKWWLGINDIITEGEFLNADGTPAFYRNWASGEPNNADNEDCVTLGRFTDTDKWNDARCYYSNSYICEYQTESCRSKLGVCNLYRGTTHLFVRLAKTWRQAQHICRSLGMDLVSVENSNHMNYLSSNAFGIEINWWWTGLNDINVEGNFEWSNGSKSTYRYFDYGEPNSYEPGEDCVHFGWNGSEKWNDHSCESTAYFICAGNNVRCPSRS